MNRLELIKQGIENLSEEDFNKRFGDLLKNGKYFIPKEDEAYYFVGEGGVIQENWNVIQKLTNYHLTNNKLFKTKEEAEHHRDKQQFLLKMERDFLDNSDEIDWGNDNQEKNYLFYDYDYREILTHFTYSNKIALIYTTNEDWLKQYIKDNEADIKKYYFDIKENK